MGMKIWKLRVIEYASTVALATMLTLAILSTGCATLFGPSANLTEGQIKAYAADKNATAICTVSPTPWGAVKIVVLSLDKSAIASGGVVADGNCDKVGIQAEPKSVAVKPEAKP